MGTKNDPAPFDCYAKAEPDEPMFVLLARDPAAPATIRRWVSLRIRNDDDWDDPKIHEAYECAEAMEAWRKANR